MRIILRIDNLSRQVGDAQLVRNISIGLKQGEVLAVVGPSGSGKTSFLRLLNRLDEPTEGTVYFNEVDYRKISPPELRRQVGMVTQRPFLFPGTVAENVGFGPLQRGERVPIEEIEKLLAQVGLEGFSNREVSHLSGGESQRVSFARTLANRPKVLLLDEPTAALDEKSKLGIETLIKRLMEPRELSTVIVTHDMSQAARLGDRLMKIEKGQLVQVGTVDEVLNA